MKHTLYISLIAVISILSSCQPSSNSHSTGKDLVVRGNIEYWKMEDIANNIATENNTTVSNISKKGKEYVISFNDLVSCIPKESFEDLPITEIILPEGISIISDFAFADCTSLKQIVLPNSLLRIEPCAFKRCSSLSQIHLPESLTFIGLNSFQGSALKTITIPPYVTEIDESAFWCCKKLKKVILPDNLTTIRNSVFQFCNNLSEINMPSQLQRIEECAFADCSLKKIVLPYGLKEIGYNAFGQNPALVIDIPSSVTSIDGGNFDNEKEIIVHSEEAFKMVLVYQRNTKITKAF